MKRIILLVLCVLLLALPSYGATYNVGTDYETLAAAFEAASYGELTEDEPDPNPEFKFTSSYVSYGEITINNEIIYEAVEDDDPTEIPISASDYEGLTTITFSGAFTSASSARHFIVNNSVIPIIFNGITLTGSSGGGITLTTGTITFNGTNKFTSNKAENGGALYIASGAAVTFNSAPEFTSNTATSNGGALYIASGATVTLPSGQIFTSNTAENGGAIYNAGTLTFSGTSTFTNNNATSGGGAIYAASGANITFSALPSLSGNLAENGGAFYVAGGQITFSTAINFAGESKTGTTNGGLFYVTDGTIEFKDTATFSNYIAANNGGVFYVTGGTIIFGSDSTFTRNSLTVANLGAGGAIYNSGGNISFSGAATFTNNSAYNGGAVALSDSAVMPSFSSTATFTSNTASNNGGAIWSDSAAITPTSSYTFESNTATQNGGAIFSDSGNITISGLSIDVANTARNSGGFVAAGSGTISVNNSSISNQTALIGGAICGINITINSADFITNTSTTTTGDIGGGAVCISQDGGRLQITNSRFIDNSSTHNGGAVAVINAAVTATNLYFEANDSDNNGGAMYLAGDSQKTITNVTFNNNISEKVGGAIWSAGRVTIRTSYFVENKANSHGGAVYYNQTSGSNLFEIIQSMAVSNASLTGSGGAIYVISNNVNILQSTFNANTAIGGDNLYGGSVYMSATAGRIENSTFAASRSYNGGGLALYGVATMRNCAFILNNIATNYGGGLYLAPSATLTAIANIFVGNGASIGGDVYKDSSSITSTGYNRIGIYGEGGNNTSWVDGIGDTAKTDRENRDWTTSTFYGSNNLAVNARSDSIPPYVGYNEENRLLTIALAEVDINEDDRAINIIPYTERTKIPQYDARGYDRYIGTALDIGPVFFDGTRPDGGDDEITSYTISSVKMSGIPNTLKSPGQTANLSAIILYTNGLSAYGGSRSGEEPITWSSSNRNVVRVSNNGVVTAWRTPGTAYITVSTVRAGGNGSAATDTQAIIVDFQATSMNLSDAFIDNLLNFNQGDLYEHDMSVAIANVNESTLSSSSFRSAFYSNWSYEPALIDELDSNAVFSSQSTYNMTVSAAANETFNKPGVKFSYSGINAGELLPITYSWAFNGTEAQTIFGYNFADKTINATLANDIFKVLQIDFAGDSQAWHVLPSSSVTASEAYSAGALALTKTDNGQGIRIDLTVYLSNVSGAARLVNNLLVLPDGVVDSKLNGTMWVTRNNSGSGGGGTDPDPDTDYTPSYGGGGGGGGCNSLGLGLIAAALILAFRRK